MKSRLLFVVCALFWVAATIVVSGPAYAQPADALKKAQSAFDQAQQDYLQGKFDDAAKGFQEAYASRQFPQFLYNIGASFHMKGKKDNDAGSYEKAVDYYKQYLSQDPTAQDKPRVEKAIGVLEGEIKRLKDTQQVGVGSGSGSGSGSGTPAVSPVAELGDVKVRGLVVIESEPANATIYLDDKKKGAFATTPWSGSLDGEHKLIIEKRGYKIAESTISADPSKLFVLRAVMSEEGYLGWVDITSNIPGADIFIDDQAVGAVGKTPLSQNFKPGKHTFWITAEGYNTYKEELDVLPGQTHTIKADLQGTPVGKLDVVGLGIEDSSIYADGQVLCERGPCLKALPQGEHTITVKRPGFKPYSRRITIQAKTSTEMKVGLAPNPSRSDAVIAYILAAGFGGGAIFLGLQANHLHDDLNSAITKGSPPPDNNDPRFTRGKIFAIAADASFALAGITALTAIYYTFRDKGLPSTALIDVKALALEPQVGPGYAGLGMEVHW